MPHAGEVVAVDALRDGLKRRPQLPAVGHTRRANPQDDSRQCIRCSTCRGFSWPRHTALVRRCCWRESAAAEAEEAGRGVRVFGWVGRHGPLNCVRGPEQLRADGVQHNLQARELKRARLRHRVHAAAEQGGTTQASEAIATHQPVRARVLRSSDRTRGAVRSK